MKKWISSLMLTFMIAAGIAAPYQDVNAATQAGWTEAGGHWYYHNTNGSVKAGWLFSGGKWYYLNPNGLMQTGWVLVNGKWYFLNANGAMQTGWVKSGISWYYLDNSGAMATGWRTISGKQYCFTNFGTMAVNTTIGGKRIGSDGAVVQGSSSVHSTTTTGILSITNPAPRNSITTLRAVVAPNSVATIAVHYRSGDSKAQGLEPKRSDANGNVSWSWHVGGNTTIGPVDVTVSCNGHSYDIVFNVIH